MLTPEYLNSFTDGYLGMCDILNEQIAKDVARRIAKTGKITASAEWQLKQAQQSGALIDDVVKDVSKLTDRSEEEIIAMFRDAGIEGMMNDAAPLLEAGKIKKSEIVLSGAMKRTMEAAAEKCKGDISNLTLTTAAATQQQYIQALNEAYLKVTSGAFSYQEAIRQALRITAKTGAYVLYDSGYQSKIDVAIRTAVLTGVNQTAGKLTELYSADLGAEYYETTAHPGARPSHSLWQGRVFKIDGSTPDYPNFAESTGYGTGAGLCGWNCRHSFYPFWPGISKPAYTKKQLERYDAKRFRYHGQKLTEYECSQIQRQFERQIREYKRILSSYSSYMDEAKDEVTVKYLREEFVKESQKLKEKERQMKDFCNHTNRRVKSERAQVTAVLDKNGNLVSFNRSVSGKAVWAAKKGK